MVNKEFEEGVLYVDPNDSNLEYIYMGGMFYPITPHMELYKDPIVENLVEVKAPPGTYVMPEGLDTEDEHKLHWVRVNEDTAEDIAREYWKSVEKVKTNLKE